MLKEPLKQSDKLLRHLVPFPIEHKITKSYKGKDMKLRKKKQAKQKEKARQLRQIYETEKRLNLLFQDHESSGNEMELISLSSEKYFVMSMESESSNEEGEKKPIQKQ